MAVTETRTLPAPFIESLGKTYADILPGVAGQPTTTTDISATMAQRPGESTADFQKRQAAQKLAATQFGERQAGMAALGPKVAGLDQLQQDAIAKASGLGAYAPHLQTATTELGKVSPYVAAAGTGLTGAAGTLGQAGTALTGAGTTLGQAGTQLTGAQTTLGGVSPYITAAGTGLGTAGTTLAGAQQYITGAGTAAGPSAYQTYMSPYQQQVIDKSLAEFDVQAQKSKLALGAPSVAGAFGGGRHGLAEAEYQSASDRNRGALQANLLQQGYTQAQDLAGRAFTQQAGLAGMQGSLAQQQAAQAAQQLGLGAAQSALAQQQAGFAGQRAGLAGAEAGFAGQRAGLAGQEAAMAQQQLGLGAAQTGLAQSYQQLAGLAPQLAAQEISGLGSLGAVRQAQAQAQLDADRQLAQKAAYEPMERAGWFGGQVTGLMGGYPAQYTFADQPQASPLSTALQAGTGLASIFGNVALGKKLWGG